MKARNTTREESLALARRIRAAGIPIRIAEDDEEAGHREDSGLLIRQVGGVVESSVDDSDGGLTQYIIHVCITSNLPGRFAISSFGFECPLKDPFFQLLEDPVETGARRNTYRFPGTDLEFERSQVINHLADVRHTLSRGQSLQGFLLGVGFEPIPDRTWPENLMPAFLKVFDQYGREYSEPVFLWVVRSQRLVHRTRTKARRKGLFDSPDWEPGRAPLPENGRPVKK